MVRILLEAVSCSFDFAGEKERTHCVAQCPLHQDKLQTLKIALNLHHVGRETAVAPGPSAGDECSAEAGLRGGAAR